jgi:hypothetical protein
LYVYVSFIQWRQLKGAFFLGLAIPAAVLCKRRSNGTQKRSKILIKDKQCVSSL